MKVSKKIFIPLIISIAAIAIIAGVIFSVSVSAKKESAPRKPAIAFYNLDEKVTAVLQNQIEQIIADDETKFEFVVLDPSKEITGEQLQKYDLLFTLNGKTAQNAAPYGKLISSELFSKLPNSFAKNKKILPLLLDHHEVSFYTTLKNKLNLSTPENFSQLKNYLSSSKDKIEYPSICAGKNDTELLGFVSNVVLSLYGADSYVKLADSISSLSVIEDKFFPEQLKEALDEIKSWQNNSLIAKNWYEISNEDVFLYYTPERITGTIFMSLSLHRKINSRLIQYFETTDFPKDNFSVTQSSVCPAVCALIFNDTYNPEKILAQLLTDEIQEKLSDSTLLAPVSKTSYSHDTQTNDIRFWAASSSKGPLPDLGTLSFSDPKKIQEFAKAIRIYLSM